MLIALYIYIVFAFSSNTYILHGKAEENEVPGIEISKSASYADKDAKDDHLGDFPSECFRIYISSIT